MELIRRFDAGTMTSALESWGWIGLDGKTALFASSFGDVFLQAADGIWFLDKMEGTLVRCWDTAEAMRAELNTFDGQAQYLSLELVWEADKRGLVPSPTQVYDFRIPPALGGAHEVGNVEVCDFSVALYIAGQVHDQVRHLPPGTPISGFRIS